MKKTRIGLIYGGASEEHPISLKSAGEVARHLDPDMYDPYWIYITTAGNWYLTDAPNSTATSRQRCPVTLSPDRNAPGLLVAGETGVEVLPLDVVFPVLHGKYGEDGAIQGLLELAGIPYVGCDIQSSTICMDKSLTYTVAQQAGIQVPSFTVATRADSVDPEAFSYPLFVKPARSGSSFGVTRVERAADLPTAMASAFEFDTKVLIEGAVSGTEIGCAVQGSGTDIMTGELDQVVLSRGFFRIHQEDSPETGSENSSFRVPAPIADKERQRVYDAAKTVYHALGCRGLARVDLFLTEDGSVILNEVNTMPGLTSYSRYPRMMAAAGITPRDLINRLITDAMKGAQR